MSKMKRTMTILLALVMLVFAFAGCNSAKETKVDEPSANNDAKSEETATLEIWGFFEGFPKEAADYYSEISGVEINYVTTEWNDYQVKLSSSVGTDEMPDILQLPIHFLGRYAKTGQFMNLDEAFGGREEYERYKELTATATLESGYFEGVPIGIGWEANVGAYFYREDLAREAFGINSVEEMEAIISTWDGFYQLNEMRKPGYEDVAVFSELDQITDALLALTPQYVVDNKFEFTEELEYAFTETKKLVDMGMIYLDGQDQTAVINAAQADAYLGNLAESWWVPNCKTLEQEGLWRVANPPVHFSNGGTWWAIPANADKEKAWEFLTATFLNEDWLYSNLSTMGNFISDGGVMQRAIDEGVLHDEYFGDQVIGQKFIDIEKETTEIKPKSEYFMNIHFILWAAVKEYAWDGVYASLDEAYDAVENEINSIFPDIEVVR